MLLPLRVWFEWKSSGCARSTFSFVRPSVEPQTRPRLAARTGLVPAHDAVSRTPRRAPARARRALRTDDRLDAHRGPGNQLALRDRPGTSSRRHRDALALPSRTFGRSRREFRPRCRLRFAACSPPARLQLPPPIATWATESASSFAKPDSSVVVALKYLQENDSLCFVLANGDIEQLFDPSNEAGLEQRVRLGC